MVYSQGRCGAVGKAMVVVSIVTQGNDYKLFSIFHFVFRRKLGGKFGRSVVTLGTLSLNATWEKKWSYFQILLDFIE